MALAREDLKSFQARIAERLRVAREQGADAAWLAVSIRGMRCLFPLSQTNEVLPPLDVLAVPYVKTWFLGAVNARGRVYGVVDLARFWMRGKDALSAVELGENPHLNYSLISLNPDLGVNCVLKVDTVLGLRSHKNFESASDPPLSAPDGWGSVYSDASGVMWQEINLQGLVQSPQFLSISE